MTGWPPGERERWPLRPAFARNPGWCPEGVNGKRVEVALMTGDLGRCDDNPMSPPGWAADGRGGACCALDGGIFNIDQYRVL